MAGTTENNNYKRITDPDEIKYIQSLKQNQAPQQQAAPQGYEPVTDPEEIRKLIWQRQANGEDMSKQWATLQAGENDSRAARTYYGLRKFTSQAMKTFNTWGEDDIKDINHYDANIKLVEAREQAWKRGEAKRKGGKPEDYWNIAGGIGESLPYMAGGAIAGTGKGATMAARMGNTVIKNIAADTVVGTAKFGHMGWEKGSKEVAIDAALGVPFTFAGQVLDEAISGNLRSFLKGTATQLKKANTVRSTGPIGTTSDVKVANRILDRLAATQEKVDPTTQAHTIREEAADKAAAQVQTPKQMEAVLESERRSILTKPLGGGDITRKPNPQAQKVKEASQIPVGGSEDETKQALNDIFRTRHDPDSIYKQMNAEDRARFDYEYAKANGPFDIDGNSVFMGAKNGLGGAAGGAVAGATEGAYETIVEGKDLTTEEWLSRIGAGAAIGLGVMNKGGRGQMRRGAAANPFYSKLRKVLEESKQKTWNAEQLEGYLIKQGVKPEEMKWSGVKTLLKGQAKVSTDDLLKNIKTPPLSKVSYGGQVIDDYFLDDYSKQYPRVKTLYENSNNKNDFILQMENDYDLYQQVSKSMEGHGELPDDWARNIADDIYSNSIVTKEPRYKNYTTKNIDGNNYREDLTVLGPDMNRLKEVDAEIDKFEKLADENTKAFEKADMEIDAEHRKYIENFNSPNEKWYTSKGSDDISAKKQKIFDDYMEKNKELTKELDLLYDESHKIRRGAQESQYHTAHYQEGNILYHVRKQDVMISPAKEFAMSTEARMKAEGKKSTDLSPEDKARYKELRSLPDEKVLHIEEIQSDLHQEGRKKGYKTKGNQERVKQLHEEIKAVQNMRDRVEKRNAILKEYPLVGQYTLDDMHMIMSEKYLTDDLIDAKIKYDALHPNNAANEAELLWKQVEAIDGQVPDMPYTKSWHEKAMKDTIAEAVEKSYDRVTWTKGQTQADRYNITEYVDQIAFQKNYGDTESYYVGSMKNGTEVLTGNVMTQKEIANTYGKEIAEKIVADASVDKVKNITGVDLEIGSKGMKGFYDEILPNWTNKYIKQFDSKVETKRLPNGDEVWSFKVTDKMREDVETKGQPLFSNPEVGGAVAGGALDADQDGNYFEPEDFALGAAGAWALKMGINGKGKMRPGMLNFSTDTKALNHATIASEALPSTGIKAGQIISAMPLSDQIKYHKGIQAIMAEADGTDYALKMAGIKQIRSDAAPSLWQKNVGVSEQTIPDVETIVDQFGRTLPTEKAINDIRFASAVKGYVQDQDAVIARWMAPPKPDGSDINAASLNKGSVLTSEEMEGLVKILEDGKLTDSIALATSKDGVDILNINPESINQAQFKEISATLGEYLGRNNEVDYVYSFNALSERGVAGAWSHEDGKQAYKEIFNGIENTKTPNGTRSGEVQSGQDFISGLKQKRAELRSFTERFIQRQQTGKQYTGQRSGGLDANGKTGGIEDALNTGIRNVVGGTLKAADDLTGNIVSKTAAKVLDTKIADGLIGHKINTKTNYMMNRSTALRDRAKRGLELEQIHRQLAELSGDARVGLYDYMTGNPPANLDPALKRLGDHYIGQIDAKGMELVNEGVITQEAFDTWKGKYLHRRYLSKMGTAKDIYRSAKAKLLDPVHARGKTWTGGLDELKAYEDQGLIGSIADGKIQAYDAGNGKISFRRDWTAQERASMGEIKDAAFSVPETIARLDEMAAHAKLLHQVAQEYVAPADLVARSTDAMMEEAGYTFLKGERYGALNGKWVDSVVNTDLSELNHQIFGGQNMIGNAISEYMKWFKSIHTIYNPKTHMNNIMSNLIGFSFMEGRFGKTIKGVFSHALFAKTNASKYQTLLAKQAVGTAKHAELRELARLAADPDVVLWTKAQSNGLFGRSNLNAVLNQYLQPTTSVQSKTGGMASQLHNKAGELYQFEDDIVRFALFKQLTEEGLNSAQAIDKIGTIIPDYTKPMSAAAAFLRRYGVAPFVSFPYYSFPIMANQVARRPSRVIALGATIYGLYAASGIDPFNEEDAPERFRKSYVPIPGLNDGNTKYGYKYDRQIPHLELLRPQKVATDLIWGGNPYIGAGGHIIGLTEDNGGYAPYFNSKITHNKGARGKYDILKSAAKSFVLPDFLDPMIDGAEKQILGEKAKTHPVYKRKNLIQDLANSAGVNTMAYDAKAQKKKVRNDLLKKK